ncbi:MAG: TspO/MBR family protein [Candidatus Paceibacterota bacterium]|jgi:tryptophan-rich sensory protein
MKKNKIILFIISILIPQVIGFIGGISTASSVQGWYKDLVKPSFAPPNWLFMPAWLFLYFLMGVALFLILKSQSEKKKMALSFFSTQLILNMFWSIIFFGLHQPLFAFIEIIILWIFILLTIIKFYKIDRQAALLLIPYQIWVTFASVLNFALFYLNK